jgi:hypothetical protein
VAAAPRNARSMSSSHAMAVVRSSMYGGKVYAVEPWRSPSVMRWRSTPQGARAGLAMRLAGWSLLGCASAPGRRVHGCIAVAAMKEEGPRPRRDGGRTADGAGWCRRRTARGHGQTTDGDEGRRRWITDGARGIAGGVRTECGGGRQSWAATGLCMCGERNKLGK